MGNRGSAAPVRSVKQVPAAPFPCAHISQASRPPFSPSAVRMGQWFSSISRVRPYTGRIISHTFRGKSRISSFFSSRLSVTLSQPWLPSRRMASPFIAGIPSPAMVSRPICPGEDRHSGTPREWTSCRIACSVLWAHWDGRHNRTPCGIIASRGVKYCGRQSRGWKSTSSAPADKSGPIRMKSPVFTSSRGAGMCLSGETKLPRGAQARGWAAMRFSASCASASRRRAFSAAEGTKAFSVRTVKCRSAKGVPPVFSRERRALSSSSAFFWAGSQRSPSAAAVLSPSVTVRRRGAPGKAVNSASNGRGSALFSPSPS